MHLITIPEGIEEPLPIAEGRSMEAGHSYICGNAFAGALLQSPWRVMIDGQMWALSPLLKARLWEEELPEKIEDVAGAHVWLMRGGGYGDLLMLTPLIQRLQQAGAIVHVACGERYFGLFDGLNVKEEHMPIDYDTDFDYLATFEGWIEGHPDAMKIHMAQHFANKFKVDLEGEHTPFYRVTPEERAWAQQEYPRTGKKRVGIQWMASALARSYRKIGKVAEILSEAGCEVFMFGAPNQFKVPDDSPMVNTTQPGLSFRRSVAVAAECDCLIVPDSSFVHIASALNLPCVALYGAFPASLRVSGSSVKSFQAVGECSPCFYHGQKPTDFPAGMPCAEAGYCTVIDQINPKIVTDAVAEIISPIIRMDGARVRTSPFSG